MQRAAPAVLACALRGQDELAEARPAQAVEPAFVADQQLIAPGEEDAAFHFGRLRRPGGRLGGLAPFIHSGRMVVRIVLVCKPPMYICICNAVTEREIRGAISLGSASLGDLKRDLGVASCCGKCEPDARRILGACGGSCGDCAMALAGD